MCLPRGQESEEASFDHNENCVQPVYSFLDKNPSSFIPWYKSNNKNRAYRLHLLHLSTARHHIQVFGVLIQEPKDDRS